ncbi:hypothetical protein [Actinoallomurus soli]|uniref:hypothetical protein n=1 Tax=Actinoallomurus soli TaxID=2952535 RepID=UPI002092A9DE|nr:hypothetical protein [Actinoallomurus soli]MCO5967520.1 hypothetical protein [Actinoallomurus soli]
MAVGPAQEVVSVADRRRLGLDAWPDTALGVVNDGGGKYRFFATGTPGLRPPQKVTVTSGTLSDPVADGVRSAQPVANVPSGYDYAGGGPVFRDARSGQVLEMLHLERPYGNDASKFYTELHLGRVDPKTGKVVRLGEIVRPHVDFTTAQKTQTTIDLGAPSFSVTRVGKISYLYVYFSDATADGAGRIAFTGLSVARAPITAVLAAAKRGKVSAWSKYQGGRWAQPALGGASADINAGRPMAWAPDVVRGAGRTIMVTGESPHDMVLSTSANGVNGWSTRHPLWRDPDFFDAYPTIVAGGSTPNAPGKTFFVYYTQWQSAEPDWSTARLMRRTVRCTQGTQATDVALVRYSNGARHQVTTGPAPAGFHEEGRWYLRSAQEPGTVPLYGCRNGRDDQFLYKSADCGGSQYAILQTEGWIYAKRPASPSVPLYRCHIAGLGDHFVSERPDCEAPGNADVAQEGLLGYALDH